MNVTLKDFKTYRASAKEVERLTRQLKRLKESNNRRVKDKVSGSQDEYPYTKISLTVKGKTDNTKAIKRRGKELAELRANLIILNAKLQGFLKTVKDKEVRDTLILYYIDGCRYCDIQYLLGLDGDGSTQMKKIRRFFEEN